MFLAVMAIFLLYGAFFLIFEDYGLRTWSPMGNALDWHLLWGSIVVMALLALLLHRYARRMDERISREQAEQQNVMRRQLTQNITHELKTPVASIMGYTETLLAHPDIDAATRQQFIERTHVQAQRLIMLLQDITLLNRMDYAAEYLVRERIDVASIVADVVEEMAVVAAQRRVAIHNCLPQDIGIIGVESLVCSIFRNLLANAVNYAGEDSIVVLRAVEQPTAWQFSVSDNGVGIAAEHLPHIFERFYRIDKGRSREQGGSGLGLAIVKNAVVQHGGTIAAEPNQPHGISFIFTLQKK